MVTTEKESDTEETIDVSEVNGRREMIKKFLADNKGTGYTRKEIREQLGLDAGTPYCGDPDIWKFSKHSWYTVSKKRVEGEKYYHAEISRVKLVVYFTIMAFIVFFAIYFYLVSIGVLEL